MSIRDLAALLLIASAVCASRVAGQAFPDSAFDARTAAELRRIVSDGRAAGLPEAPLLNRIRQGAARRVAPARLVALVRAHADSMRAARVALGAGASSDELDAGASALHAGASRATLRRLRSARPEGTATTAMVVLADLLWRGVPSADAGEAIAALAQRSTDQALLALQGAVARDGTPASAQRLQSLIDRLAIPVPDSRPPPPAPRQQIPDTSALPDLPASGSAAEPTPTQALGAASGTAPARGTALGTALGTAPDTERASASSSSTTRATPGSPVLSRGSLALASLSAPGRASPQALLAEGSWSLPIASGWTVTPAPSFRIADGGSRWGAALTAARELRPGAATHARLWLSGEMRSPVARARSELPLTGSLDARTAPPGRPRDLALFAGADVLRHLGGWIVGSSVSLGRTRFSTLETILVQREIPTPIDTITPRPDTLGPSLVTEPRDVWRVFTGSTAQGALSMRRGGYLVQAGVAWRLGELRRGGDSLLARPRTLLTVGAERQLSSRTAIVAQWASHDPSRITGTLTLSDARWRLGLRLAPPPSLPTAAPRPASGGPPPAPGSRAIAVTLDVDSTWFDSSGSGGALVRVRVSAPGARTVHVEGDLTDWKPSALEPDGAGVFLGAFVSGGSLVRLRLRVDGGQWIVPAGAPTQRDDFGDVVAVYVLDG